MEAEGLAETPSAYYERTSDVSIDDWSLATIQRLVDNPKVGGKLINGHWHVVRLGAHDGSLVLSSLIAPSSAWALMTILARRGCCR